MRIAVNAIGSAEPFGQRDALKRKQDGGVRIEHHNLCTQGQVRVKCTRLEPSGNFPMFLEPGLNCGGLAFTDARDRFPPPRAACVDQGDQPVNGLGPFRFQTR